MMKYQSLAAAIMADSKSKVTDENLEDMIFSTVLKENMETIVNGCGE